MKAKYLFYSFALASAFTACTQDEIVDAPVLNNASAERPVVGVVTFANGDVDSRYNSEAAKFENGDKMGLYLMDEFTGDGESLNANETLWTWQSCWWTMYNMVDYINTNYGYVYNEETGEWINRASQLIEGNYIAMFPQNTRATNRQDLWHPIKANVDLVDHSSTPRYYVNRENQFFVGYEQIMRDQKAGEETGELRADITMKPILTYAKMYFENQAANNFKIQKVVFKAPGGQPLPNVAYVNPSEIVDTRLYAQIKGDYANYSNVDVTTTKWAFANNDYVTKGKDDECGYLYAWGKYDRNTFNHAAARSLVQYDTTIDKVPYGMTAAEATPVYEYVFNFPADADILKSNQSPSAERICGISIALPAFEGWQDMEVVVYGEMWDPTINFPEGGWRPGIIRKLKNVDNGEFTLDQLKLWTKDANMQIPSVTCRIDDNYFYQNTEIRVSTTQDLYDLIKARLSNASNTEDVYFDVQHYGNGLEITKEVVDLIKNYEKAHNVDVVVTFNNTDRVETPVIFKTNAIDVFKYVGVNVVAEVPQTIVAGVKVEGIDELRNFSTIEIKGNKYAYSTLNTIDIVNEIGAVFTSEYADIKGNIHNQASLTIAATTVEGNIHNDALMTANNASVVTGFIINNNECVNCGADKAVLTIGGLKVGELTNYDDVVVVANGNLNIVERFANVGSAINNGTIDGAKILNGATFVNNGSIKVKEFINDELLNNYGYVLNITNNNTINAYEATDIDNLFNAEEATLHVWSTEVDIVLAKGSEGTTIFEGVDAQHVGNYKNNVDQCPAELRVYRAYENTTAELLKKSITLTRAEEVWTKYDIVFDVQLSGCSSLTTIKVEAANVKFSETVENAIDLKKQYFTVAEDAILNIVDNSAFAVKGFNGEGEIHIGVGSKLYTVGSGHYTEEKTYEGHQIIKL